MKARILARTPRTPLSLEMRQVTAPNLTLGAFAIVPFAVVAFGPGRTVVSSSHRY